ncbi:hypothetical protein ScPMuIL_009172 [Solemya velum]
MPVPSIFLHLYSPPTNGTDLACPGGVQWAWNFLHDCVYDSRGIASVVLGLLSIVCWLIVGIPQMVMNCRNIQGIAGVSFFLLAQWTLGDTTNLIGSFLTEQLPLQTYLAIYFVAADLVLLTQFIYYKFWRRRQRVMSQASQDSSRVLLCVAGAFLSIWGFQQTFNSFILSTSPNVNLQALHHPAGRNLLTANLKHRSIFYNAEDEVGYAIGILSSIFYLGSRSAQLWKNYKRQSTVGLSSLMFILAVLGNLTYGGAILVRSLDGVYIIRHIPWLVGSLGVIALDLSLLIQFKLYSRLDQDSLSREHLIDREYPATENPSTNYSE